MNARFHDVMTATRHPSKWTVLALVGIGVYMATLDASIVNVSLPVIAHYFGRAAGGDVEWVVIAYLIMIAALLLTVGRVSDVVGLKRVWTSGLVLFTMGSTLCGAAPSLVLLIAARVFQGVGGAFMMAVSPALLISAFPKEERGRAIGMNAVVVGIGISSGPTIGGIVTEHASWRWIFYVNLPIGIVATLAALWLLPDSSTKAARRFDVAGALLLAVGLAALTASLSLGNGLGWGSFATLSLAFTACASIAGFFAQERRHPDPVVDLSLFRNRVFLSSTTSLVLSFLASFAISFLFPFYALELRHFGATKTGLLLTPLPLTVALVAPFSGSLADKIGTRWLAVAGLSLLSVALFFLSALDAASSTTDMVWRLGLAGLGRGLFQSPNNSALMGSAPRDRQGVASGMLATCRVVGQCLSVALAGAMFAGFGGSAAGRALVGHPEASDVPRLEALFTRGFHAALLTSALVAALGACVSLVRGDERFEKVPPDAAGRSRRFRSRGAQARSPRR